MTGVQTCALPIYIPANYLHSFSRLNILNQAQNADGTLSFDQGLRRTYVLGADQNLYVFQAQNEILSPDLNPVKTPLGQFNVFSGNPLSIVDAQPAGAAVAWKYIADSNQMVSVGYYPGDQVSTNPRTMARCLTMGMLPPIIDTTVTTVFHGPLGGNLIGQYQYMFAYRRLQTGARSNPSAATRQTLTSPAILMQNQSAEMVLPDAPLDPQTGLPDVNIVIDVYRFGGSDRKSVV